MTKRMLIAIALAAALVLAGCAGPGGEGVNNSTNGSDGAVVGNDTGNDSGGFGDNESEEDTGFGSDNETNDTGMSNDTNMSVADA